MRGGLKPYNVHSLCPYTAGQVGWRDSDGDNILDPLDTSLVVDANMATNDSGVAIVGLATDTPYPSTTRTPISTNRIASAQYRVNGGPWRALQPTDASFDSATEVLAQQLPPAPMGSWQFEVVAYDTAGNSATKVLDFPVGTGEQPTLTTIAGVLASSEASDPVRLTGTALCQDGAGTVLSVEYSLDAGVWQPLDADDGLYDSSDELFTLVLGGLAPGTHRLQVRAWATSPWTLPQPWEQIVDVPFLDPGPDPGPVTPSLTYTFLPLLWDLQ